MKIPLQSRKRSSINERLHLFAKDEKGYPFYQLALETTRRKMVPFYQFFYQYSIPLQRQSIVCTRGKYLVIFKSLK